MSREIDPTLNKTSPLVTHLLPSDKEKVKLLARAMGMRPGEWLRSIVLNEIRKKEMMVTYERT